MRFNNFSEQFGGETPEGRKTELFADALPDCTNFFDTSEITILDYLDLFRIQLNATLTLFHWLWKHLENNKGYIYQWQNYDVIEQKNIEIKGEISHVEQFLLLPQLFQKSSAADASKCVWKRERVSSLFYERLKTTIANRLVEEHPAPSRCQFMVYTGCFSYINM